MKFRAKIDTPWCKKGEIYMAHTYAFDRKTFSPKDIPFGYECVDHPEDYPDLFEPVEEKSNQEKWEAVLEKKDWNAHWHGFTTVAGYLDFIGIDATQAYEKIVEGKWLK